MINFDVAPFYDDATSAGGAIDNNYMRILFRPGYAVQARELTSLQTILQNQISNLGDFVFQDGSPVQGGHISIDTTVWALQLQAQYANVDINLSDFYSNNSPTLVLNSYGNVKAMIVGTDSTQTNPVVIIKYLTAAQFQNTDTIQVTTGLQPIASVYNSNTYTNRASTASINEGVFYSGGFFVQVPAQTIVLDSTTNNPSYFVGLSIEENIIDEVTDTNLLDPAQGSFNYQAPGAERYQYELILDKRSPTSTDFSAFYSLCTVVNGQITQQIDYPIFADLDKSLAQRTYDTNGDFVVNPFVVTTQDNAANPNTYYLVVEPGKAYVKGFEFETIGAQKLLTDKARTLGNVTDYTMSLNFGNYITVQNLYGGNVSGMFDYTQYQNIDLHISNSASILTSSSAGYAQTKIGTAHVRDIEYLGNGGYFVYLTDISMNQFTFIAAGGTSNVINVTIGAGSPIINVYTNVSVTVNTGGIIDSRYITSYNPSNTGNATLNLNAPLSVPANSTSNVSVYYGVKDVNAGVVTPNTFTGNAFYNQNSSAALYACFDVVTSGKTLTGNTILNQSDYDRLIFPLPQNYVSQNTITNASFQTRRNLWSTQFTSGSLTVTSGVNLATGESFPFNYSGGSVPSAIVSEYITVIVRSSNPALTGLANGQILNFGGPGVPYGSNTVTQTSSTSIVINANTSATFIADVIMTVVVSNAQSASVARRSKTLVGNSAQTFLQFGSSPSTATRVMNAAVSTANTVYIDTNNAYVWFTSNTAMAMTPGATQSLYVPDVINVLKILDSGNVHWAPANGNVAHDIDITANYYLDSGQRDSWVNFAYLTLKPGASPPSGQTVVICQYFQPDTLGNPVYGFFDCDSYTPNVYSSGLIPYYNSVRYGTISLRDSIDFRPYRTIGANANVDTLSINGFMVPSPESLMTLSFGYYLPRVDKLMLSKDKVFRISEGVPAQYPVAPQDSDDAMTLYVVSLPAYTGNVDQIQLQYIENKRYTMKDIGGLDSRIQTLELVSNLNKLERQIAQQKIFYKDGVTQKTLYGILAEDFSDFSICDNQNNDLRCWISKNSMSAYKDSAQFTLALVSNTGGYYQEGTGKTYTLPFTEVVAVSQNTATNYAAIQPVLFAQFKGVSRLSPQTTSTYNHALSPQLIAPPASTAFEQPPAPAPASAPAIAAAATTQAVITTVGSNRSTTTYSPTWDYWYYVNGKLSYYKVNRYISGYGAINPFYNWYGIKSITTTTSNSAPTIPNGGTSIRLAAGTAAQSAAVAISTRGGLHLFGNK